MERGFQIMIIYSDKTKKRYDTVEDCLNAEKEFDEALIKKQEEQKALSEAKKTRADAVVEAYKKMKESEKEYIKLKNAFIKDYGYFHMSFKDEDDANIFTDIFSLFKMW